MALSRSSRSRSRTDRWPAIAKLLKECRKLLADWITRYLYLLHLLYSLFLGAPALPAFAYSFFTLDSLSTRDSPHPAAKRARDTMAEEPDAPTAADADTFLSFSILPSFPSFAANLSKLNLRNQGFAQVPAEVWACKQLTQLDIGGNPVTALEGIQALGKLRIFFATGCKLGPLLPPDGPLAQVTMLSLTLTLTTHCTRTAHALHVYTMHVHTCMHTHMCMCRWAASPCSRSRTTGSRCSTARRCRRRSSGSSRSRTRSLP